MLCTLYHDIKRTTTMLLLCDHSVYLTHALHTSCLVEAPRNFSNDFQQIRTVYYTIVDFYPSLIIRFFQQIRHFYDVNVSAMLILLAACVQVGGWRSWLKRIWYTNKCVEN
jgi:hypothetical protein